ncbi:hypothetical protein [Chryseobacterium sp. BIGb0232]|uniref:hypothetical protein n=1 Tax=Chryseobacterium sp. BIGb0232 TaxID=2940598 RepID=UPI000F490B70|nr:hypothetical protein [Chryseobacterium sp. BIGb0232]MCS4301718.1 hypothetical protein [Chryseobacterium sp. BIGb0232]ROS19428.1 hypothetical protein EDF65_0114 [Chryseobacterium nakagawai]
MFKFFRKKKKIKVNLHSVTIPDQGWEKVSEDRDAIRWVNPQQSALIVLHYFDREPDLPTAKDLDYLKRFYRNIAASSNGGNIETDIIHIHNIPCVKTIIKTPQQETGMAYIASITIPFEDCSYVIKIQTDEIGITGMRDALILDRLHQSGEVEIDEESMKNWFEDPYDPDFRQGTLMNKSELEKYDHEFPEHPLSIARSLLRSIIATLIFKSEIKQLPPFKK